MAEKKRALIIANSEYQDPVLRQLIAPAQDAEVLAQVLNDPAICGFEVQTVLNEPRHQVEEHIETFFGNCDDRNDLLLLYFSGHGVTDDDGLLYYAACNTQHKKLRSTAVSANFVNETMTRCRSRRQVLLLDCCHSGAFARTKAAPVVNLAEHFGGAQSGRGKFVLASSDAYQYSFEGDTVAGSGVCSVFTQALVEGLRTGEADFDGDGIITLDELYDYVHRRVTDQTPNQSPKKWAYEVDGNLVIAQNPRPVGTPLPDDLQQALNSFIPQARDAAVQRLDGLLRGKHRGLSLAAFKALEALKEDDSIRVRSAAEKILSTWSEQMPSLQEPVRAAAAAAGAPAPAVSPEKPVGWQVAMEKARVEREEREQRARAEQARLAEEEGERHAAIARQAAADKARQEQEERERQVAAQARLAEEEAERHAAIARQAAADKARQEQEERDRQVAAEKARLEQEQRDRATAAEKKRTEQEERERLAAAEKARVEQEETERLASAEKTRLEGGREQAADISPSASPHPAEQRTSLPSLFLTSIWGKAVVVGVAWAVWSFLVTRILPSPYEFIFLTISAGFGVLLGLFLKKTVPSFRWPDVAAMMVGWSLAGFLGAYVSYFFRLYYIGSYSASAAETVIGLVAGGVTALVIREAQTSLTLRQAVVIAAGYAAGATVSFLPFYFYAFQLRGVIFAMIGSAVMFWQLSKAAAADKAALGRESVRPEQELSGSLISPVLPGPSRFPASMQVILGACGVLVVVLAILWPLRPTSASILRKKADAGDNSAMLLLAETYRWGGIGVEPDPQQSLGWYRKAAEAGNVQAMKDLAYIYEDGYAGLGVNKDRGQVFNWDRKAAEAGDVLYMAIVGELYEKGDGVDKDPQQAVVWYRKAADAGYIGAMTNLGYMYANGNGVQKDNQQAVAWYRKAAAKGDSGAMFYLGVMYANGNGVQKDYQQAVEWYGKAAEKGESAAMTNLGSSTNTAAEYRKTTSKLSRGIAKPPRGASRPAWPTSATCTKTVTEWKRTRSKPSRGIAKPLNSGTSTPKTSLSV